MTPYYNEDGITIYHGDCREILPELDLAAADLLVTDPPYGVAWRSGKGNHEMMAGDNGSLSLADWLPSALRALRRGRHAYIFGVRPAAISPDLNLCGLLELIWDKEIMGLGDLSLPWGPQHEPILFGVQEISRANRAKGYGMGAARLRKGSVLRVQNLRSGQTLRHPTEKPVGLLRILIESSSTFGEIVLDPFMGSGSTLEAARLEGRCAIGIEIEESYCEIVAERLTQVAQGVLPL